MYGGWLCSLKSLTGAFVWVSLGLVQNHLGAAYRMSSCSPVYNAGACRISPWDGRLLESHWASNSKIPHRKHMMGGAILTPALSTNIINVTTHWFLFLCVHEGQNQIHDPRLGMNTSGIQGIWVPHLVLIVDFPALEIPLAFACLLTFKCFKKYLTTTGIILQNEFPKWVFQKARSTLS